jgi:DNA-binding MarR family transcriptional regulator
MTGFLVLGRLALEPGRTVAMTHLARQLCFTTGGFTKLCDRLVDLGLVERRGAAHDRRVVLAVLTERGGALAAAGLAAYAASLRRAVVAPIGVQGLEELGELARRLAESTRDSAACAVSPLAPGRPRR